MEFELWWLLALPVFFGMGWVAARVDIKSLLSESRALAAAHGVQVLELRPGIMATDMTSGVKGKYDALLAEGLVPQRRWGTAEDVGRAVRAVLAGHFPFTTGDVIHLDGGFHIRRL